MAHAVSVLEAQMRYLQLWEAEPPSAWCLSSRAPFCIDTLRFEAWLQWVFIPHMLPLIERQQQMPVCQLLPMGQVAFVNPGDRQHALLAALQGIDQLASRLA